VDDKPATAEGERDLLGRFTRAYISVFSAEMERLLRRNKRDFEAVAATLGPVLRSIAEYSAEILEFFAPSAVVGIAEDVQRSIASRAAKWPEKPTAEVAAQITQQEFLRALRAIQTNIARERAAQQALAQLGSITEGA
jgi:hypothetical protein